MQKRIVASMVILISIASFAVAQTASFSQFTTPNSYINDILTKLLAMGELNKGKKEIVTRFCSTALSARMVNTDAAGNTMIYDPRQSVFLYMLCRHVGTDETLFYEQLTKESEGYIKLRNLEDFGLICQMKDDGSVTPEGCIQGCNASDAMMNGCDFSALLPDVFKTLMNDYSNGALSLVYGVYDTEDKKVDELANDFGFQYLDGVLYTSTFTEYPDTHSYLKNYLKKARKLTTKTKIIALPAIIKQGRTLAKEKCGNEALTNATKLYDIFACPYSNASIYGQNRIKFAGYINVMYNEMMRYQMFVNYYAYMISENKVGLQNFGFTTDATKSWEKVTYEITRLQKDIVVHQEALRTTIRMLTNIHSAFAIHIGLQMYYEEVKKFRNALTKIYTPLHQLYYKLRNVQAKK